MDVSAPVRPSSRPTQAYYVPRRLLEGGRGPYPANDGKPSQDGFTNPDTPPPNTTKSRPNTEKRRAPRYTPPQPQSSLIAPSSQRRGPAAPPQPFAPRIVNGPRGPLSRPNAFCAVPFPQKDICICDRPKTHVVCKRCGYECIGRVQLVCDVHPTILSLMDMRECANPICRSIQIFESFTPNDNNNIDDQLITAVTTNNTTPILQ
ncbi:unnamed protein product [Haemonchus placei]|uniref:Phosphatidylinositol-4,5-bisphosphate 4-phosphatase n=1 Tax=Haemonchus placei TaxID=6290 RepID=A0A0N4W9M6_HAEPC|nr:unnamed protein product [Haemonchus placei]